MKIAFALWALLASPQEDWREPRLQAVLRDLSEFARDVDAGTRTLQKAHAREGQPQGMLGEIRALAHTHPDLAPIVGKYIRSKDEPIMGRALAVLAVALPEKSHVAVVAGNLLSAPPDSRLSLLVLLGYSNSNRLTRWRNALDTLRHVSDAEGWKLAPLSISPPLIPSSQAPEGVDLRPMVEGLISLVKDRGIELGFPHALRLLKDFSFRREVTKGQRDAIHELFRRSYLEGDKGFQAALGYLLGHGTRRPPDLDFIARGLPKLADAHLVWTLSEVSTFHADAIFKPPFSEYLEKAVKILSLPGAETSVDAGPTYYLIWALKKRESVDPAVAKLLMSPSEPLRRRMAMVVR